MKVASWRGRLRAGVGRLGRLFELGVPVSALPADALRRIRVTAMVSCAIIAIGIPFVLQYWRLGLPWMSVAVLATIGVAIVNVLVLRRSRNAKLAGLVGTSALFSLLLLSNWCSGGFYDPNFGWLYVVPLVASLMVDARSGWIFTGLVLLATTLFWLAPQMGLIVPNYVPSDLHAEQSFFNRISAVAAIGVVLGAIASQQRFSERLLREANDELRAEMAERARMRGQLVQNERLASMGALAAGVAHEVNNPLTFVVANLELLRKRLSEAAGQLRPEQLSQMRQLVQDAAGGARRVSDLVRDLRTFSRDDDDEKQVFDMADAIDAAITIIGNELRHRAKLIVDYQPGLTLLGNEGRLVQVFLNLLSNAMQAVGGAGARGDRIVVSAAVEGEEIVARVRDEGPGIDEEVAARIFEPFYTTKPVGVGTGLGLSISRNIIAAHGGEIRFESSGAGTTFEVRLPAASGVTRLSPNDASRPVEAAPSSGGTPLRVLVVDDEVLILRVLREVLRDHDVTTVTDGEEALRLDRDAPFDVILCDVMMPQFSGVDLLEALKAERPGSEKRVIFMTGGTFGEKESRLLRQMAQNVLEKPLDLDAVVDAVERRGELMRSARGARRFGA